LKSCLSKSNDEEILDFLKSINDKIDNKTNDQTNKNVIELKKILERHERHIDTGVNTPDNKKIDRLCFLLNVVDAVKDEDKKSKLRTILDAESENFLKEVADYAKSFGPPTPTTKKDNDDFLGLGKFLSDFTQYSQETAGAISKFVESIINPFTKKSDESPPLSGSSVASIEIEGSISGHDYNPNSNQNQKLDDAIFSKDLQGAFQALENGANFNYINLKYIILENDDSFASEMIKFLKTNSFAPREHEEERGSHPSKEEIDCILNKQYENGNTALHLAVLKNKTKTYEELIKAGADITIKNNQGQKAKDLAILKKTVQRLLNNDSPPRKIEQPHEQISGSKAFRLFDPIEKLP